MFKHIKPTRLCLSGGGVRVISYIGALQVLEEEEDLLKNITEFLGVSAGALVALLLCLGYSLTELNTIMRDLDFSEIRAIDPEKLLGYDEHYGIDDGEGLRELIKGLLKRKGLLPGVTFIDLPKDKKLRIWATDLNDLKPREFSAKTTPNVTIQHALRASMALPFYFTPVRDPITGHLLTDGGVIANYPIIHLTPFEAQFTIGLTFDDHKNNHIDISNILGYFNQMMSCFWIHKNMAIYTRYSNNTIIIPCSTFPSWDFEITYEEKEYLYKTGQVAAKEYLKMLKNPKTKFRRRSVA